MLCIRVWGSYLWVTTGTKYTSYVWVVFCNGYHGYQVCPVFMCGGEGTIYGYHGYQVHFFCVSVFVMGTTGTKYVLDWVVWE